MNSVVSIRTDPDHLARSESDHRIANNLSVISSLVRLKAQHLEIDDIRRFLIDVAARIDTVARLHRLLALAGDGRISVARFLQDVCTAMKDIASSDEQLRTDIDCPEAVTLSPESALRVGLLTAELLSNAVKYAHPTGITTSIRIRCRQTDGMIDFSFEDDGIGFPENFDPHGSDSFGMQILHLLSQQLDGAYEWRDSGIGLGFGCRFPSAAMTGQALS